MSRLVSRFAVVSLFAASFVVTSGFASPSDAATKKKHIERREVAVAAAPVRYVGAAGYYGAPPNYYPAPPFPFFLLPGPWWLPAHP